MENKKKKKFYPAQIFTFILYSAFGYCSGHQIGSLLGKYNMVLGITVLIISTIIAFMLAIIIHESGHLVFGLISGYKFSSFRIMNLMWTNDNGKIRLKYFSLAGTGGQCLMAPPDMVDGKIPVALYNLGGSLMNLIVSALFFGISLLVNMPLLVCVLRIIAAFGIVVALMNGIPLRMPMADNDGYNALSLGKNPKAMRALWLQLKVNDMISKGHRLRDMPDEWFTVPTDEEMQNSMISVVGVFCCNRLMDQHRFAEADELMAHFLGMDALIGIHRGIVLCDRIYCEMIGENRREAIDDMLTKEQKHFMKAMATSITVLRTEYLYALLCENNAEKAEKIKARFEKQAKKYPYSADIASEQELIAIAEGKI